jgi:hypothetical protein
MSSEELGLRYAAVTTLAIPPPGTVGIEHRTTRALDGDIFALEL